MWKYELKLINKPLILLYVDDRNKDIACLDFLKGSL